MSHPLVEILDAIQDDYELDLETTREESDITRLIDKREAQKIAAFEARDIAVAEAVRDECFSFRMIDDEHDQDAQFIDLKAIIKTVLSGLAS